MWQFWAEDLVPEREEELLDKAASTILRKRMETPAILFLASHRPLSFIGSQFMVTMAPFVAPILGFDRVNDYSRLFSDPKNVDRLVAKLEQGATESKSERGVAQ